MSEQKMTTILAGGCFWGLEELFLKEKGILKTRVGYCGGHTLNPTYETVKLGDTGHAECMEITFNSQETNYHSIFHYFFSIHDPTTTNQQGNDIGSQYRSAIFYSTKEEESVALKVIEEIKQKQFWESNIITEVIPLSTFYSAEEEHQKYLQKHPGGYTCHFKRY